jgi:hypothetical protein
MSNMTCSENVVKNGTMSKAKITSRCPGHGLASAFAKTKGLLSLTEL